MLKEKIEQALKTALLGGDRGTAETLKVIKSAILYEELQQGAKEVGLSDEQQQAVLRREAKKRAESAEVYDKAGETERTQKERAEKTLIETFLPAAMSDEELESLVDQQITALGASGPQDMGKVIGAVKAASGGRADGSVIAGVVKTKLQKD